MLDRETKRRIDTARDILVGKVPDPKSQVEQITIALMYKFMGDMDAEAAELGGGRRFFTGEFQKYGWKNLMSTRMGGHEVLNLYAEGIAKMNENAGIPLLFRDIFKNAYLPYRDPETLKSFLKIIDDFEYDHSERLGDAFEYLLSVLDSQGEAGQFRTPRHIIDFMVEVIDPGKDHIILDPACGTAGFLISSYKHILKHNSSNFSPEKDYKAFDIKNVDIAELSTGDSVRYTGDRLTPDERSRLVQNIKGYDISPDMVRLSLVNLYLHGFTDPHIIEYDTLTSEDRWNEYADVIMANPPFMSPKGGIKPHKRFSIQSKRSEVLFVDYIAEHLSPNGRAAVIVPEGIIFQSGTAYKQLRKMLVEDYLFAVVSLPSGVFNPYSGVKTSILLLDKTLAKKVGTILFVKIDNDGFGLGAQRMPIKKNDIPQAVKHINDYLQAARNGGSFDIEKPTNVLVVNKEKIAENGEWNLSGIRYEVEEIISSKFKLVELGTVCELIGGGTPSRKKDEFWNNGIIKWISSKHIDDSGNINGYELITEDAVRESSTRVIPKTSTILITRVSVGKSAYANDDYAINQDLTGIVPIDNTIIDNKYLFILSKNITKKVEQNAQGLGVRGVTRGYVSKLQIPLPPLEIQQEIVAEIGGYQKIIDGARAVVDNYRPQIQIDPKWDLIELDDQNIFKIESGGTPKSSVQEYWNGTIKWATLVDLPQDNFITQIYTTRRTITERGLKESSAKLIPANSIILSTRATIGRVGINRVELATNQGFKNIVIKDFNKAVPEFVAYMVKELVPRMEALAIGGTFKEISKSSVASLRIPLPPIEIQRKISTQIGEEQELIKSNKKLITLFERKIKDKIASVWGD